MTTVRTPMTDPGQPQQVDGAGAVDDGSPVPVPDPGLRRLDLPTEERRQQWRAVVDADPDALPEHTPEWVDAICAGGAYEDATRVYAAADGRRFVVPLVRRTGVAGWGGWYLSPPPAWGMGGVVGADLDENALRQILTDLIGLRAQRLWFRPDPLRAQLWDRVTAAGPPAAGPPAAAP